jgi:hypothetical protein
MNLKKTLESRIRGWFPRTPTQPQHPTTQPGLQRGKPVMANPLPPILETRFQRSNGIIVGLGVGLLLIGLCGAFMTSSVFNEAKSFFSYTGVDPNNYLYRHIIDGIAIFLTVAVAGALMALLGGISLKSQIFRNMFLNYTPLKRLGNFFFGAGIGFTAISFHSLFTFLLAPNEPVLNHNNFQLELFTTLVLIGASLTITGIAIWRLKE